MTEIKNGKLKELIQDDKNMNKHNEYGMSLLEKSISKYGLGRSILVDKNNKIIAGNGVTETAANIGLDDVIIVPTNGRQLVVVQRTDLDLDSKEARELALADNAVAHVNLEWDEEQLQAVTEEWGIDWKEWGVDLPEFENVEEVEAQEDDFDVPEGGIETDIIIGDLFEIGEHRLLCGDSTDSDSVAKLMNGEKADVGFNDPPYGMKKENEGVLNDNLNYNDLLQFNKEWIALQFSHIKDNGSWYCWGTDEPLMDIYSEIIKPYIKEQKATFRNLITWDKGSGQGQNSEEYRMYPIADEKCLFVMMGVQGFANDLSNWYEGFEKFRSYYETESKKAGLTISKVCELTNSYAGHYFSRSQYAFPTKEHHQAIQKYCIDKGLESFKKEYEEIKKEYEEIKKEWYSTRSYFDNTHDNQNNVWHFDRTSHEERKTTGGHATPKPIQLCERAIKSSCPENGLVIDYFLGSGSTMSATHQLNRKCYGMELDPKYCQVIVDRMIKLDPTLEIKRNGELYIRK